MKTTTIGKMWRNAALGLLAAAAVGCNSGVGDSAAALEVGDTALGQAIRTEAVQAAELPPVAGCDSVATLGRVRFTLSPVAGVEDLYLVRAGSQPLCIDSLEGISSAIDQLRSHRLEYASSNPMPGVDPTSGDSSSNPMPGVDPAASNTSSNPMPGNAK